MFMKDRVVWFLCLVIWLGLGPGDRHSVADVTEEHAVSGTERRVAAVGWTSVEGISPANDRVAVVAKHRDDEDDLPVTEYTVSVTNNGPVILGSFATFVATVTAIPSIEKNANGNRLFAWTGPISPVLPQYMFGVDSCTIEIPFEKNEIKPGEVTIKVTVSENRGLGPLVGEANSSIKVTDTINGHISMSSSAYPECNTSNPSCSIPTNTNLTLEAELHDPGNFFEGAFFSYKWDMGDGVTTKELKEPYVIYNYSMEGEYNVTVHIKAVTEHAIKTGVWWRTVRVLEYTVSVTNNGPVILGSFAVFVATVTANPSIEKNANGIRLFTWTGPIPFFPQYMTGNDSCTIAISFDKNKIKPGEVTIKVTVRENLGLGELVGEANSSIQVTDTMNGHISMSSSAYPECNTSNPSCSIPTKTNLTLEAELHDPGDFFEGALFFYKWNMGDGVSTKELREPFIIYNYSMKGEYNVTVNIETKWKDRKYNGTWWRTVTVLDAITNLTIASQSSSVQVGNNLTVNLTCNGSLPVELCLTVDEPSSEWSNQTNTSCETVLSGTCGKSFVYNFKSSGKYTFQAAASNDVSFAVSVSTIHAHDPQPPLPPQSITAITVAIIAGLSMTCFAVVSFLRQVRKNKERHIEVANFDFQFRERSDSFGNLRTGIFSWKRGSEKKPLMNNSNSNFYSL